MRPIPVEAVEVVTAIRSGVPKPDGLPTGTPFGFLRWVVSDKSGQRFEACPMGLHPKSSCRTPIKGSQFAGGICTEAAVVAFVAWWDNIIAKDAQEAVDAIWA